MTTPSTSRPEVSLVTATRLLPERLGFLGDLRFSIAVSDVDWEWIVVVDGPTDQAPPAALLNDPRIRVIHLPRNVGQAAALNFGIHAARADHVMLPDDDDSLAARGLARLLTAVRAPGASWAAGPLIHQRLGSDGAWFDDDVWTGAAAPGPNAVGDPWRAWTAPDATLPLAHATMLVETTLARAVGGLQGLAAGEGLGYVMAVTSTAPGVMLDVPVYRYRQHANQSRRTPDFHTMEALVRDVAWRRGQILATR